MLFTNNLEFIQNIHWEYVFIFLFMIGFTVESYILYLINKQTEKINAEYKEVKKKNDELIEKLQNEITTLRNMVRIGSEITNQENRLNDERSE